MGVHPWKVSTFEGPHKHGVDFAIIVIIDKTKNMKRNSIFQKIIDIIYRNFRDYGDEAIACKSISHALDVISGMQNQVERIWVIGGSSVYKVFCTINFLHLT